MPTVFAGILAEPQRRGSSCISEVRERSRSEENEGMYLARNDSTKHTHSFSPLSQILMLFVGATEAYLFL